MKRFTVFLLFLVSILFVPLLWAQDVPFIWGHSWPIGARALGLGGAYTGVADDYSAIYYNPAGLGQLEQNQIFGSLSHLSLNNKTTFWGNENSTNSSYTKLNSLGMAISVPAHRGSLVFGAGYHVIRQFDKEYLIPLQFIDDPDYLVNQEHHLLEEGGLYNVALGASIEAEQGLFVGVAVNFWGGQDEYTVHFLEEDRDDIYIFRDTTSTEHIVTGFRGVNFTLGTLYRLNENFQLGGSIVTPVSLKGEEEWDFNGVMNFEDINNADSTYLTEDYSDFDYKIQSPWILRFGAAFQKGPFLITGDIELRDYSQIRYKSTPSSESWYISESNLGIKRYLRNTVDYRVGGEIEIPKTGAKIRGGYAFYPSPYKNAPSGWDRKIITLGLGLNLSEQFDFDIGYAFSAWDDKDILSDDFVEILQEIEVKKILATFIYRM